MKRWGYAMAVAVSLFGLRADAAPYVYLIQSYPGLQNNYTISGRIVTDGITGYLQATDILSWTYTISRNGIAVDTEHGSYDTGPNGSYQVGYIEAFQVYATGAAIYLPNPAVNADFVLSNTNDTSRILWVRERPSYFFASFNDTYEAYNPTTSSSWFDATSSTSPGLLLSDTANWVVATAAPLPEPSSILMMTVGLVVAGGVAWHRRRTTHSAS